MPSNDDVLTLLSTTNENTTSTTTLSADKINEMCVVVWQNCDKKYVWYLSYVKKSENNMLVVDHLDLDNNVHIHFLLCKYHSTKIKNTHTLEKTKKHTNSRYFIVPVTVRTNKYHELVEVKTQTLFTC